MFSTNPHPVSNDREKKGGRTTMSKCFRIFVSGVMLFAILLLATPLLAQFGEAKGNLFGRVVDEQGGALPGVAVTLKGPGAPMNAATDARGEFRFLNLTPG